MDQTATAKPFKGGLGISRQEASRTAYLWIILCIPGVKRDRLEIQPALEINSRDDIPAVVQYRRTQIAQSYSQKGTYWRVGTRPSTTVISGTLATTLDSSLLISFPSELGPAAALPLPAVWGGRDKADGLIDECG